MIVRRVGPLSFAKLCGALYAIMGLIIGAFISLFSVIGSGLAPKEGGAIGMLFGVAAIVALPIFYGALGFVTSLVGAALYNMVASWVGGVEIDVQ